MIESGVSPLPRDARPYQGRRAGLVTRMAAAALDGVVVVLVLLVAYGALAVYALPGRPARVHLPGRRPAVQPDRGVRRAGRLPDPRLAAHRPHLRRPGHGAARGERPRSSTSVGRVVREGGLLRCVPIGLLWVAVSRENRSVQDVVLRTSVVYDWQPTGGPHTVT